MHIKKVTICGFRSYKDTISVDPFNPKQNVVIGRNGTGKSNFFDAIRFCLLDARFANLRQDERQALLHEGSGKHVMSAFVELIFDNTDGRLPVDTSQVVLRRTIGVKKDEFFLNEKHIPKADVMHLLESAGFSKSNPYYIVQQGKIQALALMKDTERLELLKKVAGTRVYEDRRVESLGILAADSHRREKILEVIMYIEDRLNELQEEKDELKAYQLLDKQKRALEYTLHEKELSQIQSELTTLEITRSSHATESNTLHTSQAALVDALEMADTSLRSSEAAMKNIVEEKAARDKDKTTAVQRVFQLELERTDVADQVAADASTKEMMARELKVLSREIKTATTHLNKTLLPKCAAMDATTHAMTTELERVKAAREVYLSKQARGNQFTSQAARDKYLNASLKDLTTLVNRRQTEASALDAAITSSEEEAAEVAQEVNDTETCMTASRDRDEVVTATLATLKLQRNALAEERKDAWREENVNQTALEVAKGTCTKAEETLSRSMAYDLSRGLKAVKAMQRAGDFHGGIAGPLIELVKPMDERFYTATDEAAGNALFHVVVDTDATAAAIMTRLNTQKLGRVTFLPLNRLRTHEDVHLSDTATDVMPLMSKLEFDPRYTSAVSTAFGKKLLCRDLATCQKYAELYSVDCLTLEGDCVQRYGGLNGGYKDPARSRTRVMQQLRDAEEHVKVAANTATKTTAQATSLDASVASLVGQMTKLELEQSRLRETMTTLRHDHKKSQEQVEALDALVVNKKRGATVCAAELTSLASQSDTLRSELATTMQPNGLSTSESNALATLSGELTTLETSWQDMSRQHHALQRQKNTATSKLENNLLKRQRELVAALDPAGLSDDFVVAAQERQTQLEALVVDHEAATQHVTTTQAALTSLEANRLTLAATVTAQKTQHDTLTQDLVTLREDLAAAEAASEKVLAKRERLLSKRLDAIRDIRECGTLPMAELEQYDALALKVVQSKLQGVLTKLKAYAHVNKKALDQYVSFHEQRSELLERKQELDDAATSIQTLISVLDTRKDEAILRTFKGVSHHFQEVFRELVPTGGAEMLMLRSDASASSQDASEESKDDTSETLPPSIETFAAVQIKVNFRGEGDAYLMSQLSGGQKALVALAFIFAIQRCDPAPFYLFDEVDQALDATHRAAVAALISRQAHSSDNPAQFITSTFRPEMVQTADKWYGIGHQNKISNVYSMRKDAALDFIANIMAEEEGVVDSAAAGAPSAVIAPKKTKKRRIKENEENEEAVP